MTVKEAIDKINSEECYSIWDAGEYLEGGYKLVARDLEIARHRWHETSVNVYKLDNGYVKRTRSLFSKLSMSSLWKYSRGGDHNEFPSF